MEFQLTPDEQSHLQEHGVIEHGEFVVMSSQVYRDILGISTDEDLADSVNKTKQGLREIRAGKGVSAEQFVTDFKNRHGIQD